MNIIGKKVKVLDSTDKTKKGIEGTVLLDTENMFVLFSSSKKKMVEKKGTILILENGTKIDCNRLVGSLERRLKSN